MIRVLIIVAILQLIYWGSGSFSENSPSEVDESAKDNPHRFLNILYRHCNQWSTAATMINGRSAHPVEQ